MTRIPSDREWAACPPGSLTGIAAQHVRRRRRQTALKYVGATLTVCLAWTFLGRAIVRDGLLPGAFNSGEIGCFETQRLMPEYLAGKLAMDKVALVDRHLAECPACRDALRRTKQGEVPREAASADAAIMRIQERRETYVGTLTTSVTTINPGERL